MGFIAQRAQGRSGVLTVGRWEQPAIPSPTGPAVARLARFVNERFPPIAHGPLILALVFAGQASAALETGTRWIPSMATAVEAVAVGLAFLQLRILDELRDESADRMGRPERPLPRGLVSRGELWTFAGVSGLAGSALTAIVLPAGLPGYLGVLGLIWLLGLGAADLLPWRRGMITTALIHSVIVPAAALQAWSTQTPTVTGESVPGLALSAWGAGLALEVGRKTVAASEERPGVATYSSAVGRQPAILMVGLALTAAWTGGVMLALAAKATSWLIAAPLAVAMLAAVTGGLLLVARSLADRVATVTVRSTSIALVLAVLLWPVVVQAVS